VIKPYSIKLILVTILIILSGSLIPFIFSKSYAPFLISFFVLLTFLVFRRKRELNLLTSGYFILLLLFQLGLLLIRSEYIFIKEYSGVLIRLVIVFLFTRLIHINEFKILYTKIIYYYSIISLVFYFYGVFFLKSILNLPIMYNDAGTGYRHSFIYFYQGIKLWNFRNSGLFWEGGAFVVFLTFALVFQRFYLKRNIKREIILILTILTTLSTVGYAIILLYFVSRLNFKKLYHILLFTIVSLLAVLTHFVQDIFINKFDGKNISGIDRLTGQIVDLKLFSDSPIIGVGYTRYLTEFRELAFALGSIAPTSTNSITGLLALNGFIYTVLIFTPFFLFFWRGHSKTLSILRLLMIVLVIISQGIFNQLIFLSLIFYTFQNQNNECHSS
jgi:hypothetical protein